MLLIILLAVLGVGSSWLGISMHSRQSLPGTNRLSVDDAQRLVDSRQSLLSYAVLYHYLYGPSGAGPAHLPCPDTDGYREQGANLESGLSQRRDGPNPPCASLYESDGHLPRHTVLPGNRYLFHAQPWQRFEYRVAGSMINNPVNRIVNLQHLSQVDNSALASIGLRSPSDSSLVGRVTISGQALRDATAASVAAWLKGRIATSDQWLCANPLETISDAEQTGQQSDGDICEVLHRQASGCKTDGLLNLLLDKPIEFSGSACLADELRHNSIEGVVATRHWFIRNLWFEWVDISFAKGCEPAAPSALDCKLAYLSNPRTRVTGTADLNQTTDTVSLQWRMPL